MVKNTQFYKIWVSNSYSLQIENRVSKRHLDTPLANALHMNECKQYIHKHPLKCFLIGKKS